MIYLIVYITFLIVLIAIPHYQEIRMYIAYLRGQKMHDAFPQFIDWEEGDKIYFATNPNNDIAAYLSAMCDKYVIVEYNGNTNKVYPYQIKMNQSHEIRKTKYEVETFHEEILPILSGKEKQFPQLEAKRSNN